MLNSNICNYNYNKTLLFIILWRIGPQLVGVRCVQWLCKQTTCRKFCLKNIWYLLLFSWPNYLSRSALSWKTSQKSFFWSMRHFLNREWTNLESRKNLDLLLRNAPRRLHNKLLCIVLFRELDKVKYLGIIVLEA